MNSMFVPTTAPPPDLPIPHGRGKSYRLNTLEHFESVVAMQEQGATAWSVESHLGKENLS